MYSKEFHCVHSSPNIKVTKSWKIKWIGRVRHTHARSHTHARTHKKNMHMNLWSEDPNRREHLEDLGVDGRKYNDDVQENMWIYLAFDKGTVAGCYEHSNETSI